MRKTIGLIAFGIFLSSGCHAPPQAAVPLNSHTIYRNPDYGLSFSLPARWTGYTVLLEQWESQEYRSDVGRDVVVAKGPVIALRHPRWKASSPRQDIPILVFTREEWEANLQEGIFAGGIVYELSRNGRCVFGIHSRFNADDSVEGSNEAEEIVGQNMAVGRAG